MPYTPFGDKSPWESLATRNQRVREEEQEKEKLRKKLIREQLPKGQIEMDLNRGGVFTLMPLKY